MEPTQTKAWIIIIITVITVFFYSSNLFASNCYKYGSFKVGYDYALESLKDNPKELKHFKEKMSNDKKQPQTRQRFIATNISLSPFFATFFDDKKNKNTTAYDGLRMYLNSGYRWVFYELRAPDFETSTKGKCLKDYYRIAQEELAPLLINLDKLNSNARGLINHLPLDQRALLWPVYNSMLALRGQVAKYNYKNRDYIYRGYSDYFIKNIDKLLQVIDLAEYASK